MISVHNKRTNELIAVKKVSFRGSHIPAFCFNRNNKKYLDVLAMLFENELHGIDEKESCSKQHGDF